MSFLSPADGARLCIAGDHFRRLCIAGAHDHALFVALWACRYCAKTSQELRCQAATADWGKVLPVGPGGCLVVEGAGFEASVQDADEPVGEAAEGVVVLDAAGAEVVVEGAGAAG